MNHPDDDFPRRFAARPGRMLIWYHRERIAHLKIRAIEHRFRRMLNNAERTGFQGLCKFEDLALLCELSEAARGRGVIADHVAAAKAAAMIRGVFKKCLPDLRRLSRSSKRPKDIRHEYQRMLNRFQTIRKTEQVSAERLRAVRAEWPIVTRFSLKHRKRLEVAVQRGTPKEMALCLLAGRYKVSETTVKQWKLSREAKIEDARRIALQISRSQAALSSED